MGFGSEKKQRSSSAFARAAVILSVAAFSIAGLSMSPTSAAPSCFGKTATIVGTPDRDFIKGTEGSDVIVGLDGRDSIRSLQGNDWICAGIGGEYSDWTEEVRYEVAIGGSGRDHIAGGPGMDNAIGGAGPDILYGGPEGDILLGGHGTDLLLPGAGDDGAVGGNGSDLVRGGTGSDSVGGGPGMDRAFGGEGSDVVGTWQGSIGGGSHFGYRRGKSHQHRAIGRAEPGSDHLQGGPGDDFLPFGRGRDYMDGGSGQDEATFYRLKRFGFFKANLERGFATGGGTNSDKLSSIEDVSVFGDGRFKVVGDDGVNELVGSPSEDSEAVGLFIGGGGADLLMSFPGGSLGEAGAMRLRGGPGSDYIDAACQETGREVLLGGPGPDFLLSACGVEKLVGGRGRDMLYGSGGLAETRVDGGPGFDIHSFEGVYFSVQADLETGRAEVSNSVVSRFVHIEGLAGGLAGDELRGDDEDNHLLGLQSVDVVEGRGGQDHCQSEVSLTCES